MGGASDKNWWLPSSKSSLGQKRFRTGVSKLCLWMKLPREEPLRGGGLPSAMSAFKGYRSVILEPWWLGKRGGNPRLAWSTHSSRPISIIGKGVVGNTSETF